MDNALKIQSQIRQNADEVSSFLTDLSKWEKESEKKFSKKASAHKKSAPGPPSVRESGGIVPVAPTQRSADKPVKSASRTAADHTYDRGYKKWESFKEDDDEERTRADRSNEYAAHSNAETAMTTEPTAASGAVLTPATLFSSFATPVVVEPISRPKGDCKVVDAELKMRELGNEEFRNGNFLAAVKCYTKCLGMKARNYIAFSNRAMAYLKLKENLRAEQDCDSALSIEPEHIKSLSRRAAARNALGKHRAALADLFEAQRLLLDTSSSSVSANDRKSIRSDIQKTSEMLRNAVSRAPLVKVRTVWKEAGPLFPVT